MGVRNCRKISGSTVWSQHAWANAWDITSPYWPKSRYNPLHMKYMDRIVDWLNANKQRLGIRIVLWRTVNHWNHAHVETYPRGIRTPPCAGGALKVMYPGGTVSDDGFVLYPDDDTEDDDMLREGDNGPAVVRAQNQIIAYWARRNETALPEHGPDGDFGDETVEWVNRTRTNLGLPETGLFTGYMYSELLNDAGAPPHTHNYASPDHTHPDHAARNHTHVGTVTVN